MLRLSRGPRSLPPRLDLSSVDGSSRIANGVRRSSSRFHSSSRRSLTLLARAAGARTRLGNPSARQKAARFGPPLRPPSLHQARYAACDPPKAMAQRKSPPFRGEGPDRRLGVKVDVVEQEGGKETGAGAPNSAALRHGNPMAPFCAWARRAWAG